MSSSSFRALLPELSSALKAFQSSQAAFKIIKTVKASARRHDTPPKTLIILDSSFNPPSKAHESIISSALEANALSKYESPYRVLLLFSTHNADKAPSAATFDQRLAFMTVFAEDLQQSIADLALDIDIGLTTAPYYTDKSSAITSAAQEIFGSKPRHVHLLGFDTLTRFFAAKYYKDFDPPLSALKPYFDAGHELRVTLRPDDGYGSIEEQKHFISGIANGELEAEGAARQWADQITTAEAGDGVGISSTRIRSAAKDGDWDQVARLCTPSVAKAVRDQGIYTDDDRGSKMA